MHILVVLCLFFTCVTATFAQGERATITGTVTDGSSAIIPGAAVTVHHLQTNVVSKTETNSAGIYYVPALPPGGYDLTVEAAGFKPYKVSAIALRVGLTLTIDAVLDVGDVTETVEVQATAVQLESQTSGLGKAIENRRIIELPLLGRNVLELASIVPGVIPTSGQTGIGTGAVGVATNARISGGLAMQNAVLTDGGESRATTSSGTGAYQPPLESIAEVKVETANYSAEFGRAGGGIFQTQTKSGTNEYHGSIYEFFRHDHLNANSWQNNRSNVPRGQFQRNEFGAAVGGPILRNKFFFFANYEGSRQGSPVQFLATVPTALQKSGDFSQSLDRNGNLIRIYDYLETQADAASAGGFTRGAFPNNQIPQDRIHPISRNVAGYWPDPNRPGVGPSEVENYFRSGKRVNPVNSWFGRLDYYLSEKHRIFARTGGSRDRAFNANLVEPAFPAATISSNPRLSTLVSITSTYSPQLLGEVRFSHTRLEGNSYPVSEGFDMTSLGFSQNLASQFTYAQFPQVSVQQYNAGSGFVVTTASPNEVSQLGGAGKGFNPQDTWHLQYHQTWLKNRHKMKMGVEFELLKMNAYNSQFSTGQYFFDRVYTQGPDPASASSTGGHGYASFLLGVPIGGTVTISPWLFLYQKYYAGYFQDDWRLSNKLTINLGMRYEYVTPYAEKWGRMGYIDPEGIEPQTGQKGVFRHLEPGEYQTTPERKKFSPRIGIAYQFDPKTVVRAAGSIFFAANNGINPASTDFGNGGFTSTFINLGAENPIPYTPPVGGSWSNPFSAGIIQPDRNNNFSGGNVRAWMRDMPLAYISVWNLSVQRMINSNLLVEAAYVGSKTTHLFWNRQNNAANPLLLDQWGTALNDLVPNPFAGQFTTPGAALNTPMVRRQQLLRPFPHYQQVLVARDPYGDANYQSFTLRVEKQYSQGHTFTIGYTMSKLLADTAESNTWVVGPSNALYDPAYNRSHDANDVPHRLVLSYLWDIPLGKGRRYLPDGPLSYVLGNWQFNGITVLQSGRPILITGPDQTNLLDFSYTNGRVDRLSNPVLPGGEQSLERWFNTSSFQRAAPFTVPNDSLSQPNLRGPGRNAWNISLFKNNPIGERVNVQFRAEFYNVFNVPALEARGATTEISSPQFGQILQGGGQRNIQFGIRILF